MKSPFPSAALVQRYRGKNLTHILPVKRAHAHLCSSKNSKISLHHSTCHSASNLCRQLTEAKRCGPLSVLHLPCTDACITCLCAVRLFCSNNCSLPALEVEGCRTVVTAQQVSPLPATIAGVVVGGPAAPPDVSHQLPTPLLYLLGLRGRQQRLDLL